MLLQMYRKRNKRIKYNLSKAKQYCTNCKQHICKKHSNSVIIYETCEELNSDVCIAIGLNKLLMKNLIQNINIYVIFIFRIIQNYSSY